MDNDETDTIHDDRSKHILNHGGIVAIQLHNFDGKPRHKWDEKKRQKRRGRCAGRRVR